MISPEATVKIVMAALKRLSDFLNIRSPEAWNWRSAYDHWEVRALVAQLAGAWVPTFVLMAALVSGCTNPNARLSLDPSVVPPPARSYLYGRFKLEPASATRAHMFLQL